MSKGRIVDIKTDNTTIAFLTQGIPQSKQRFYDNDPRYHGSNGTYVSGFQSAYCLNVIISIYDVDNHAFPFDIRDYVLQKNQMQKVSPQLLNYLKKNNVGKKVEVSYNNGQWFFDPTQLDVNYK